MQSVLVAGGAGFVGSNLCGALLLSGYEVICVDNLLTGDKNNITSFLSNPQFSFIKADIVNDCPSLPKIDFIFHLASPASPNKKSPRSYIAFPMETMLVNTNGTQNLLNLAKENDAAFLFASSSEIYGDPAVFPQPETYFGNVNPIGPRSVYDEAKRFGETMTMSYFRTYGIDIRIVRIFNTYGPWMQKDDGRVVSNFINQALKGEPLTVYGNGKQTRSFCFVSDMVSGLQKAIFTKKVMGEVINLGNPDERSVLEIATIIKEMTNSSSEIVFEALPIDDPKKRNPDISKAKKLLGWTPAVTLQEGLEKTIAYFKTI